MAEEIKIEDTDDITSDDKLWALLSYIFPLIAVIVLLLEDKKNRPFIKFHAVNALMLGVIMIVAIITICGPVIVWVYAIYLGIKAYGGDWIEVPVLTDFGRKQGWM